MKKLFKKCWFTPIMMLFFLASCTPDTDFPSLEEPLLIKTDALQGTWTLQKIVQVDEEAVEFGFPEEVQKMDITSLYNFSEVRITFETDAQGSPSTFNVSTGDAPVFTIESGMWEIDHPVFTTQILLSDPTLLRKSTYKVIEITGNSMTLRFSRENVEDDATLVTYEYEFVK